MMVPPDRNLIIHVTADGFREWDESIGGGKPIFVPSGTRLTLAVQLEPEDQCSTMPQVSLAVAYSKHFSDRARRTLSLRVSLAGQSRETQQDLLYSVGCSLIARYKNEPRWNVLVFSDYNAAKTYQSRLPDEKEPPEYLGACLFYNEQLRCGYW
jgi:hypothetical protein